MIDQKTPQRQLGEQLVERGLITREQLWEAMRVQSRTGESLPRVLVKLGMVSPEDLGERTERAAVSLSDLDESVLKTIPEQMVREYRVLPVKRQGNRLLVAMVDPSNLLVLDNLRLITGCDIEAVAVNEKEIDAAITKWFGIPEIEKAFQEFDVLAGGEEPEETVALEEEMVEEAPIVRLVNSLFMQAIEMDASDIHVEPREGGVRVRFRIDGMLREIMTLPRKVRAAMLSRIKIMADMDIAEKRRPQDGRIQIRFSRREIDMRVSTLPTVYGEKIVTRLLDKGKMQNYKVAQLGFSPYNLERFMRLLRNAYGIILITGPTGSGKTTTLYAALNELNTVEKNITTVEDPVEYMLPGINQTQVNVKAGMTFAEALRSILRQDPDIIMVGEMRDSETAEIAVRAATTGHLVLSTLHTNDSAGAIPRLIEMGVEPFLVSSAVLGIVAQRLVRTVCPNCKEAYQLPADAWEREFMGVPPQETVTLYRGKGCELCGGTGYKGRMPIHEVLPVSSSLRTLIVSRAGADVIKRRAIEEGMITLKEDGIRKAREGLTTVEEVMRVAYAEEE